MSLVLILAFVALMVAVVPVAHALVIASGIALLWDGNLPLLLVVQQMFQQTQSFPIFVRRSCATPWRKSAAISASPARNHGSTGELSLRSTKILSLTSGSTP